MSSCVRFFKFGQRVLCNIRVVNIQRSISVDALHLKNRKGGAMKIPVPKKKSVKYDDDLTRNQRKLVELINAEILEARGVKFEVENRYMVDDFIGIFSGSNVKLFKECRNERINILFNVSQSVPRRFDENGDMAPVRSVPKFEVVIKRNDIHLTVFCVFKLPAFDMDFDGCKDQQPDGDVFAIKDLSVHARNWTNTCFTIEAALIDEELQAMILKMLDEMGITNKFAKKLSDVATAYEHELYIEFLENLAKFVAGGEPQPIKKAN